MYAPATGGNGAKGGPDEATPLQTSDVKPQTWGKLKGDAAFFSAVRQEVLVSKASGNFKQLLRPPSRPPLPGSAAPAGYTLHKRPPPDDASVLEQWRDVLLDVATMDWVTYIMAVWGLLLAADAVIFFGTLFYWFNWGYGTWDDFGCTDQTELPTTMFSCNATTGALTYSIDDFWQAKSAAWMSWIFLYSVLIALPWRIAILTQLLNARCTDKVGVDFYGRLSEFNFYHLPYSGRLAIAALLMCNVVCQFVQSALYIYPWNNVYSYFLQPNGTVLLVTGPLQGCIFGGSAAVVQLYHESKLHNADPKRFPPTIYNTIVNLNQLRNEGHSWADIWKSLKQGQ